MIKKDSYEELLKAIKNKKNDENYRPKKYNFGLSSFDEKGEKKERIN